MIYLATDYMQGAHPEVMALLNETNGLSTPGYGEDEFTFKAKNLILDACGIKNGEVFFMVGGTQTNSIIIDRLLDLGEGVIATDTSHINVHEAGAIEAGGHKILTLPNHDGKLDADEVYSLIHNFYQDATFQHMVSPGMVYVSHPTELGTVYAYDELRRLKEVCDIWHIPLYLDGARLAYGLCSPATDLTLYDIAELCDVFYIGGTKCGTLFGEAVVTRKRSLLPRFVSFMKLHGALLAKGRLLGLQFLALFRDGLYERIGRNGVETALLLKKGLTGMGYKTVIDSPTNQQFFYLDNATIEKIRDEISFEFWGPEQKDISAVRFVTGWGTTKKDIDKCLSLFGN